MIFDEKIPTGQPAICKGALLLTALYLNLLKLDSFHLFIKYLIYKIRYNLTTYIHLPGLYNIRTKASRLRTFYNTDGLINCLRQPGLLCNEPPKSMRENFKSALQLLPPGLFRLPGQSQWAAGRRSGALFFARHLDYFIVTRTHNPYPDLVPSRLLHRDPDSQPSTRTGKKRGTATQTATN